MSWFNITGYICFRTIMSLKKGFPNLRILVNKFLIVQGPNTNNNHNMLGQNLAHDQWSIFSLATTKMKIDQRSRVKFSDSVMTVLSIRVQMFDLLIPEFEKQK